MLTPSPALLCFLDSLLSDPIGQIANVGKILASRIALNSGIAASEYRYKPGHCNDLHRSIQPRSN